MGRARGIPSPASIVSTEPPSTHCLAADPGESPLGIRTYQAHNYPYLFGMVKNSEPTHNFHDLRHTFTTWLTQCGVDYAVIQKLKGEPLPGSAKYYIHNIERAIAGCSDQAGSVYKGGSKRGKRCSGASTATWVPLASDSESLSMRNVVPRDRIELSTPAFSGLCSTN